ncbi:MAG: FmdE family protein [Chloroflexi bacterium]|nr:FmdE family protein [Chloroflexota bacterium]
MRDLESLLRASASRHRDHLCPRQVLGVRIGLLAGELFQVDLPQSEKRLFTFVETDGCLTDGISVATGCWWGNRTMRLVDYGKSAATFVDTQTGKAIRISPSCQARTLANRYAPAAADHWHAQLEAYQIMPSGELLDARAVVLTLSLEEIISQPGARAVCEECSEDVINERQVKVEGRVLCRACASGAYYLDLDDGSSGEKSSARGEDGNEEPGRRMARNPNAD